jgi:hypothetical protein
MLDDKKLLFYFRTNAEKPWNYMWFDFINKFPMGIEFLQGLNFANAASLSILNAEINDQDVTQKVRSLVSRNTALYIVDFKTDFSLKKSSGTFKLQYQYQTSQGQSPHREIIFKFSSRFDQS